MTVRPMLLAYVLANAVLYSALLPLWEGFDEPFHFGYVQSLANGEGFPDPRSSLLSRESGDSILAAPASVVVRQNLPQVTTYSEFFSWPRARREAVSKALHEIRSELRGQSSGFLNYEAHHAPLAYAALALPERVLAAVALPLRVLILRMVGAVIGGLLLYFAADRLFAELGIRDAYSSAAIFCIFSCQMTWATIAHVANDWLAVPLTVWVLVAAIRYWKKPEVRNIAFAAGVLSLGLLTKAYFAALVPAALAPCLALRRWKHLCIAMAIVAAVAGPWYARNAHRYGVITGMQESRGGVGAAAVIRAAPALNWPKVVVSGTRAALWTGNNSFTSFSGVTSAALIAAWLVALVLWAASRHTAAEWITVVHCALFAAALAYISVVSFVYTRGAANGPSPWYSTVIVPPLLGLAFLGCSRKQTFGRFIAAGLVALFGYVLIATYVVKLVPLYGGYEGRTSLALLAGLYSKRSPELLDNLGVVALAPGWLILVGAAVVTVLALMHIVRLTSGLFAAADGGSTAAERWISAGRS